MAGIAGRHDIDQCRGGINLLCNFTALPLGPRMMKATDNSRPQLKIRRVNLDTGRENVGVISRRSTALRPEVFNGFSRVELRCNWKVLLATLILTANVLVNPDEIGLADPAFRRFAEAAGSLVTITPDRQSTRLNS